MSQIHLGLILCMIFTLSKFQPRNTVLLLNTVVVFHFVNTARTNKKKIRRERWIQRMINQ